MHMSLIAYGGVRIETSGRCDLSQHIAFTKAEINDAGVQHLDQRPSNMLWNTEVQRVMFIDFGRAVINDKRKRSPYNTSSSRPKKLQQVNIGQSVIV